MQLEEETGAVLVANDKYISIITPSKYILQEAASSSGTPRIVRHLLGRMNSNHVVIDLQTVSNAHALIEAHIEPDGIEYFLHDRKSYNGTYVNGEKITVPYLLQSNDAIGLGAAQAMLRFVRPISVETITTPGSGKQISQDKDQRLRWDGMRFWIDDQELLLSVQELRLMEHLYQNSDKVCSRESCAQAVWGQMAKDDTELEDHPLTQLLYTLRINKLRQRDDESEETKFIRTIRGRGYVLNRNPVKKT